MIKIWSPATYERSTTVVSYLWIGLLTEAKVRQPWVLEIIIITNVVEIIIYLVMIVGDKGHLAKLTGLATNNPAPASDNCTFFKF